MSEEKKELNKELKKNECCEGNEELSLKELAQVSGGASSPQNVVDGVKIIIDSLHNINPDDNESIDVLKDASSTAIYGTRGAN